MMATRREILRGMAGTTAAVASAGVGIGAAYQLLEPTTPTYPVLSPRTSAASRLIRPPGALEEAGFLAACIRCYRCQDACQRGAIQFLSESEGKHYHTPYIDPEVKACNLCMECGPVCPTGALAPMETTERSKVRMGSVELREDLCLSYKAKRIRDEQALLMDLGRPATESAAVTERRGPCGECYMFCPLKKRAIGLEPGAFLAPVVFAEQCAGCGMCEEICRAIVRGEPAIKVVPTRNWV